MRKLITIAVLILTLASMTLITGCGETQATLEDIAASDASIDKTITKELEAPEGTTVEVSFSGDSFDITYTYEDALKDDAVKILRGVFEKNSDSIKENCEAAISDIEKQTAITGVTGTIHINNADGSEIWYISFPENGSNSDSEE